MLVHSPLVIRDALLYRLPEAPGRCSCMSQGIVYPPPKVFSLLCASGCAYFVAYQAGLQIREAGPANQQQGR